MVSRLLQAAAVVLGFVAIYLIWTDTGSDYAFAAVVLTICAAFLSYRFRIRDRLNQNGPEGRLDPQDSDAGGEAADTSLRD